VLKGKILRLDVDGPDNIPGNADDAFPADPNKNYAIPADNPFIPMPGAATEICHYGLRNPWRCSFDRGTHDLYIGDVGQTQREEVSFAAPWRRIPGYHATVHHRREEFERCQSRPGFR